MRSIALYKHIGHPHQQPDGEGQQTQAPVVSEELHINIWKVQQGHLRLAPKLYIDFGIMTSFRTDKMYLYLPFQIVGKPVDLGKKLQDNREMLCTVFNENLLNETQTNNCYSHVTAADNPNFFSFYLFQLGSENITTEIQEEENEKGTYIKIMRNGWYDNQEAHEETDWDKKVYMRLRIEVEEIKEIVRSEFVSNDLFQAAFSKVDLYDIRVNETREIHPKVCERMHNGNFELCKFQKIHLFYMADSREKVENESSLKSDSRILEEGKWSNYEPQNDLHHAIFLAHHWKRRKKDDESQYIGSFSLFFSTIYPHMHWLHLAAFLSVVVVSGWAGGMLEFDFCEISCAWKTWIRPAIVTVIIMFVIIYALILNYGSIVKIFRRR